MAGVSLGAAGLAQLPALVRRAGPGTDAVYSSPQPRCQQTAAAFGLTTVTQAALDEIDFGAWTGRAFADLEHDPGWREWNANRDDGAAPDGERAMAAQERAVGFVMSLPQRHHGGRVILVTHGDIIKSVLCHMLGLPLQAYARFAIDPASVSTLALGGTPAVTCMNVGAIE